MSPTITSPALNTGAGIILGTASYMSPEQARGKAVDKRSDVWAFGCVLYEMLTGRRAFAGDDVTDVLARVLERDVDLGAIPASAPPAVHRLLRRCLAKDPHQRLSGIDAARLEIDDALTARPEVARAAPVASPPRWERAAWVAAVVGAAAIAGGAAYYSRPAPAQPDEVRFEIPITRMRFGSDFAVSPDGRLIAFTAPTPDGRESLWIRALDSPTARLLPGTENTASQVMGPAWSPDSRSLVFAADGNLKKIDVTGGPSQTLTPLGGQLGGAAWNRDNVIIFGSNDHGLRRISASGGEVTEVSTRDESLGETYHDSPVFLPDGKHFLYLAWSTAKPESRAIFICSLDSPSRTRLMTAESTAAYSQGRLLFVRGDTLVAQPFDPDRLQFTGDAVALGVRVAKFFSGEVAGFSVSDTGTIAYREPGNETPIRQLVWMDRSGKTVKASDAEFRMAGGVRLSPNGRQVAVTEGEPPDIFLYDFDRQAKTRFTTNPAIDHVPVWSPDGTRVVFDSHRRGPGAESSLEAGLYEKPSNGATAEQPMLDREAGVQHSPRDWAADGSMLIFAKQGQSGRWNLWGLPLVGDRKPFPYRSGEFNENEATLSPNGRFLAFTSNESGRNEVIVQPFPDPSRGRWQISTEGGSTPRWRRDGRELYYMDLKGRLMGLSVTTAPEFGIQQTTLMVQTTLALPLPTGGGQSPYDVTPDGQRFLVALPLAGSGATPISVRVNWAALAGN